MGIMGSVVLPQHLICRVERGHEELSLQFPLGKAMTYTLNRKKKKISILKIIQMKCLHF